jgi:hypothetical protein
MIGHTHFPVATLLDSGCWFINNGCLIPPDGFSASIGRIHKKHNVQMLWESTEDHIVGRHPLPEGRPLHRHRRVARRAREAVRRQARAAEAL